MPDEDKPPEKPQKRGPKEERLIIEGDPWEALDTLLGKDTQLALAVRELREKARHIRIQADALEKQGAINRAHSERVRADELDVQAMQAEDLLRQRPT